MAWGTKDATQDQALTTSYVTIKDSGGASVEVITLNPGEGVSVLFDVDFGGTTDSAEIVVQKSPDGTTWETSGEAEYVYMDVSNRESDDPAMRHMFITGTHSVRFLGRKTGSTDTVNCQIHFRLDGITA